MRGLGYDHKYHAGRLEEIAEKLADCEAAYVVFESGQAWREALKFAGVAAGLGVKAYLNEEESEADDLEDEDDAGEDDGEEGDEEAG